jgi:hypothetical protein
MNQGRPLRVQAPRSRVVQEISALATALVPLHDGHAAKPNGAATPGLRGWIKKLGIG